MKGFTAEDAEDAKKKVNHKGTKERRRVGEAVGESVPPTRKEQATASNMYKIEELHSIHFLRGKTLQCFLVARYHVEFRFDEKVAIVCNHMFLLVDPEANESWVCVEDGSEVFAPQFPPALFGLLQSSVQDLRVSEDERDLTVVFENGAEVTFSGDCDMYECYHVYNGDQHIVV